MPDLKQYEQWLRPRGGGAIERNEKLATELLAAWRKEDRERKAAKRLLAWYHRDRQAIEKYIKSQAEITFGKETDTWQIPVINGVFRTVRKLSMTYKTPPERTYFIGDRELKTTDPEFVKIKRMYKGLNRDKRLRQLDRFRTLLNTVHVEVVYRNGRLDWDTRLRTDVMVTPDPSDFLRFIRFARRLDFVVAEKTVGGFLVWTDADYLFVRDDGYVFPAGDNDGTNPLAAETLVDVDRPIPVVTIRKEEGQDYWGRYGSDIVDSYEQAAIQLGNLWENGFLQTHGVPVAINLGWSKLKGTSIKVGPKEPVTADNLTKDDLPPSLTFAKPDPDITEMRDLIDWFVKLNGASYGQPASDFQQEQKAESGFAKMVDNIEILDDRDEQLNDAGEIETYLHEYSKLVWNANHPVPSEHVHPESRCEATFSAVEFPESPQEEATGAAVEIQNDLSSAVDYLMKKRKISDRKEALKLAMEIVKENSMLKRARMEAMGIDPNAPPEPTDPTNRPPDDGEE